jgi:hypothetical protein
MQEKNLEIKLKKKKTSLQSTMNYKMINSKKFYNI